MHEEPGDELQHHLPGMLPRRVHSCTWMQSTRLPTFSLPQGVSVPLGHQAWQTLHVWLENSHFLATGRFLITLLPLPKTSRLTRSTPWTPLPALPQLYFRISSCSPVCVAANSWRYRRRIFSNERIQLLGRQNNERQGDCLKCRN